MRVVERVEVYKDMAGEHVCTKAVNRKVGIKAAASLKRLTMQEDRTLPEENHCA
jgi:hypothetical protein